MNFFILGMVATVQVNQDTFVSERWRGDEKKRKRIFFFVDKSPR